MLQDLGLAHLGPQTKSCSRGRMRDDRRDKEHSTIIYESSEPNTPLLRLGWNKQDPRYMATILMDSSKARSRLAALPCVRRCSHVSCLDPKRHMRPESLPR